MVTCTIYRAITLAQMCYMQYWVFARLMQKALKWQLQSGFSERCTKATAGYSEKCLEK